MDSLKPSPMAFAFVLGFAICVSATLATGAETIELNPGTTTYDHHPSVSPVDDGTTWLAWHTYVDGTDGVVARQVDPDGRPGPLHSIGGTSRTHGPPTIVVESAGRAWTVWSTKVDGRWHVMLRRYQEGRWEDRRQLSNGTHDAIFPTAVRVGEGKLIVAWSERDGEEFRIRGRRLDDDTLSPPFDVSGTGISGTGTGAYRPVLVQHGDEVWAFWDQYRKPDYAIWGRRLLPMRGEMQRISPPGEYCLTPTALSHASGLHVAWLRKIDVVGGPGVISQWHTLHAAVREGNQWTLISDSGGKPEAAELTQGLMAMIMPRAVATGGYLGSRARPMLGACDGKVWLLWERKSDHRGSTPRVPGDLVGRPIRGGVWQSARVLHHGYVDYHVAHANTDQRRFSIVASQLPRRATRTYERFEVDVADAKPFEQKAWTGWNPITLPVEAELTPRRNVVLDGTSYKLFWADLHCHNNLSADAEGESDELNHYARDRAGLDVVVFTNNDFYNVPLTQYEYELGNLFAASQSVEGEFLSLPGYEWTSRIPGVPTASLGDSGNWLPPYRNRSFANHRSVIYPPTGGPLVHFTEVGNDIMKLNQAVADAGGITLSQHPTFKLSRHAVEVGLELTSGWSNYIARNPKLFHQSLDQGLTPNGRRLGFVANGDSHRRAPGLSGALTGIYAEALTPAAILDALRQRRCFATSGSQMFVDARAGDSLADRAFMGEEATARHGKITLSLHAIGTRAITSAVLVRDGKEVYRTTGDGQREFRTEFTDAQLTPGGHWYYWRISQDRAASVLPGNLMAAHGHLAWSSPHWVTVE